MRRRDHPREPYVRLFAVVYVLAALGLPCPTALATPSPSRVARDVHTRGRYPSDLAVLPPLEETASSEGENGDGSHGALGPRTPVHLYRSGGSNTPPATPSLNRSPSLGAFGTVLAWIFVGVCVVLLAAALVYGASQLRFKRSSPDAEEAPRPRPSATDVIDPLLIMPELSAEELARLGRHREAIHALLVAGLFATGFRPEGRSRGTTAREVVHSLARDDRRRHPLEGLLGVTELVWFGGREATLERYESARAMHADVVRGGKES